MRKEVIQQEFSDQRPLGADSSDEKRTAMNVSWHNVHCHTPASYLENGLELKRIGTDYVHSERKELGVVADHCRYAAVQLLSPSVFGLVLDLRRVRGR